MTGCSPVLHSVVPSSCHPYNPIVRVRLDHVSHSYAATDESAPVQVLDDVSLDILSGDFAVLMGASGSGKSTLLNLIGAVDKPTLGRIFLDDTETSLLDAKRVTRRRRRARRLRGAHRGRAGGGAVILRALVLRPILRERLRTALTILGIAVGVAVVVAIALSNQSALRAFRESVDAVAGRANYQIVSDAGLDENLLLALQPLWQRGVRFAPVIDVDAVAEKWQTPVRLLAVD